MTDNGHQRRAAILAYIADHIESEGYPPTYREVGTATGYAPDSTQAAIANATGENNA